VEVEPAPTLRSIIERVADRREIGNAARLIVNRRRGSERSKLHLSLDVALEHAGRSLSGTAGDFLMVGKRGTNMAQ
jgi:hypothetical protein